MADDKPFEPTAARLARAKRDGDVPRSHDLSAVASLGGAALALVIALPFLGGAARRALFDAVSLRGETPLPYITIGACVFATIASAMGSALLATYVQTRAFTFKFPSLKFEKLDPLQGLKRMLSRDSVIAGVKAVAVSGAVVCAIVPAVRRSFAGGLRATTPEGLAALGMSSLETIVAGALAVAALFAVFDVILERGKWRRRLRMTFDEIKRDHQQSEGDPQLKGRRRQAHRSLVRGSIARVKDAAFVITNPTHIAIALEYRPPDVAVPRVIVRATDEGARHVRRRARELNVPVIENVALARSLLATTRVGDFIAPDLYVAVAAIVAMLVRETAAT
ncbi:MAG: EscU/YscU/HrcU family type III secretion system export apparatus switch protein [Candidatus Eremiobacteraeota bacterium]|nr:EscU/YscU/HrcU family type III secretion system export apparatus switch protein [Candidatus Eremiobacteraeota bacterium]